MQAAVYIGIIALLIGADQFIKAWAIANLCRQPSIMLISGLLQLTYTENFGAAFSLFWGHRWPLIAVNSVLLSALFYYIISGRCKDKYLRTGLLLIIAGGLGNVIDRIKLGYVVDYLDISPLFSYPIFNFADCLVFIGAVGLAVYIVFFEARQSKGSAAYD